MPNLLPNTLDVNIVRMYKALFDQAPGYTLLTAYRQVGSVPAVSEQLNAQFASLTNAQWAGLIVQNLHLTGQAATVARDSIAHSYLSTSSAGMRTKAPMRNGRNSPFRISSRTVRGWHPHLSASVCVE